MTGALRDLDDCGDSAEAALLRAGILDGVEGDVHGRLRHVDVQGHGPDLCVARIVHSPRGKLNVAPVVIRLRELDGEGFSRDQVVKGGRRVVGDVRHGDPLVKIVDPVVHQLQAGIRALFVDGDVNGDFVAAVDAVYVLFTVAGLRLHGNGWSGIVHHDAVRAQVGTVARAVGNTKIADEAAIGRHVVADRPIKGGPVGSVQRVELLCRLGRVLIAEIEGAVRDLANFVRRLCRNGHGLLAPKTEGQTVEQLVPSAQALRFILRRDDDFSGGSASVNGEEPIDISGGDEGVDGGTSGFVGVTDRVEGIDGVRETNRADVDGIAVRIGRMRPVEYVQRKRNGITLTVDCAADQAHTGHLEGQGALLNRNQGSAAFGEIVSAVVGDVGVAARVGEIRDDRINAVEGDDEGFRLRVSGPVRGNGLDLNVLAFIVRERKLQVEDVGFFAIGRIRKLLNLLGGGRKGEVRRLAGAQIENDLPDAGAGMRVVFLLFLILLGQPVGIQNGERNGDVACRAAVYVFLGDGDRRARLIQNEDELRHGELDLALKGLSEPFKGIADGADHGGGRQLGGFGSVDPNPLVRDAAIRGEVKLYRGDRLRVDVDELLRVLLRDGDDGEEAAREAHVAPADAALAEGCGDDHVLRDTDGANHGGAGVFKDRAVGGRIAAVDLDVGDVIAAVRGEFDADRVRIRNAERSLHGSIVVLERDFAVRGRPGADLEILFPKRDLQIGIRSQVQGRVVVILLGVGQRELCSVEDDALNLPACSRHDGDVDVRLVRVYSHAVGGRTVQQDAAAAAFRHGKRILRDGLDEFHGDSKVFRDRHGIEKVGRV